jgi:hypothetical protein
MNADKGSSLSGQRAGRYQTIPIFVETPHKSPHIFLHVDVDAPRYTVKRAAAFESIGGLNPELVKGKVLGFSRDH